MTEFLDSYITSVKKQEVVVVGLPQRISQRSLWYAKLMEASGTRLISEARRLDRPRVDAALLSKPVTDPVN